MIDYKKISAGAAIFAVVVLAGSFSVSAFSGDGSGLGQKNVGNKLGFNSESHEAIEAAVESGDYTAWVAATSGQNGRMSEVINEGNFSKLSEMHKLREAGQNDEARAIAQELGIGGRHAKGHAKGMMGGEQRGFTDANGDGVCDHLDE